MPAANFALRKNRTFSQTWEIRASAIRLPGAAEAFSFARGAVAKRGRPKKSGQRYPSGDLRQLVDKGHELTLAHRAALVGAANARDYRAGFPLGILYLRKEIDQAQFRAGEAFASLRAIAGPRRGAVEDPEYPDAQAWGGDWRQFMPQAMTQSQLASLVAGVIPALVDIDEDDRRTRIRRCSKQLREATAYILIDGKIGLDVLERVIEERVGPEAYLSRREHQALCAALERLVVLFRIER